MSNNFFLIFMFGFIFSFFLSDLFTPLMIHLSLKKGWVARPNSRTVHNGAIPWSGGISIYFSFLFSMFLAFLFGKNSRVTTLIFPFIKILIPATLVFIVGFIDDLKELKARYKLLVEIGAGLILFALGIRIEIPTVFLREYFIWRYLISGFLTIFWVVLITNAINLIDGLDGLSAGIIAISSLVLFLINQVINLPAVGFIYIVIFGSVLGFLRYNFHPAKIFMGDCGSLFLGFLISAVTIFTSQKSILIGGSLFVPIIILGIPLVDVGWTVIRRVASHQGIFTADRNHIHHKLLHTGFFHRDAVINLYIGTIIFGIASFYLILKNFLLLLFPIVLIIFWGFIIYGKQKLYKKISER